MRAGNWVQIFILKRLLKLLLACQEVLSCRSPLKECRAFCKTLLTRESEVNLTGGINEVSAYCAAGVQAALHRALVDQASGTDVLMLK